jgi:uncharacterized protein (TIGR03083 family)
MAPWPTITQEAYCDHVLAAAERFVAVLREQPLDTPVPTCPGWDLRDLAVHTGEVHRWAGHAAATGTQPVGRPGTPAPDDGDGHAVATWLRQGADDLVGTLRSLDPTAPTWHLFPVAQVAGVWPRRQAHETAVHAWDAEHAAGAATPIDAALAFDGIAEYFDLVLPRLLARHVITLPVGTFGVAATDVGHAVAATVVDGALRVTRDDPTPDAVLAGPAAACLGRLWNRPMGVDLATRGDAAVAAAWLALPGL